MVTAGNPPLAPIAMAAPKADEEANITLKMLVWRAFGSGLSLKITVSSLVFIMRP